MERDTSRMGRRRFLQLSAAGVAGTVLLACQPAAPQATPAPQQPAGTEATQVPAATAQPAGKEPTKVVYWDPSSNDTEIKKLDPAYLKFNEVQAAAKVEVSHGKAEDALLAAVAAGNPPDVYWRWGVNTYGSWINRGVVKDLTPYTQASKLDWSRFVPISLEAMKWRDKYYGLPLTSAGIGLLFWNKPMFEKVGLDPEAPPKTFEDVLQFGDKLTAKDGSGNITALGFHFNFDRAYWPAFFKAKYWDPGTEKITPTDPGLVASLQWLADWYARYGIEAIDRFVAGFPGGGYYGEAHPVCKDMVAIFGGFEWDWLYMTTIAKCEPSKFGMTKMVTPAGHPDYPTCSQGGIALVVPTGAAQPAAGWSFIEYLQGWEPTGLICAGLINCAQVTDAVKLPAYADNPVLKLATELSANVVAWPGYIPVAAEYATELGKAWDLITHGKVAAQQGLQAVYDQVQPELDKALGK